MLREALTWLTTPADRLTRRSGHLAEFVAIPARRRRHRAAWAGHETRSRRAVLRAAETADPDGTALILGAGHLHDIPLDELAGRFAHVALVDLAFAAATRRRARRLGNVSCVRHDVTEALKGFASGGRRAPRPRALVDDDRIRFVASVNLLSQLPVTPGRLLERTGASDAAIEAAQRALVEAHIDWLARFGQPYLLICDRSYEVLDRTGALVGQIDPLHGAALPAPDQTWVWEIAPLGEIDADHAVRHRVVAISRHPCENAV